MIRLDEVLKCIQVILLGTRSGTFPKMAAFCQDFKMGIRRLEGSHRERDRCGGEQVPVKESGSECDFLCLDSQLGRTRLANSGNFKWTPCKANIIPSYINADAVTDM
jgi:hypothetical protein